VIAFFIEEEGEEGELRGGMEVRSKWIFYD
jgi:hypothetical protein